MNGGCSIIAFTIILKKIISSSILLTFIITISCVKSLKFLISPTRRLPENTTLSISEVKISYEGRTMEYILRYSCYLVGSSVENVAGDHLMTFFSTSTSRANDPEPYVSFDVMGGYADSFVLYNRIQDCCFSHIQYFSMKVYEHESETPLYSYDLNTISTTSAVYNFTLHWNTLDDGSKAFNNFSIIQHSFNSTSQSRQDVYVVYAMNGMQGGTYIDIGANDGVTFSNSYMLEKQLGWSGLLVEPLKWLMPKLYEHRRANNNILNACVYNRTYLAEFIEVPQSLNHIEIKGFGEDMYSGVQDTWAHVNKSWIPPNSVVNPVPCFHAQTILDAFNITHVNYLSVDAEGADEAILRSIDWSRFSADIISFEWVEPALYFRMEHMLYYDVGYERIELVDRDAIFFKKKVFDVNRRADKATITPLEIIVDSTG